MSITTTAAELDALTALEVNLEEFDYTPSHAPRPVHEKPWEPDLNPTQKLIFDDATPFILAYGEKGSGKSVGVLHKAVRHCFENFDALVLIVTPSIRVGKFGMVHDLETLILPAWEQGIGLEWEPSRLDPSTKDRILKVANRFGGWSTILQISIPYAEAIAGRIKGIAPSMVVVDELTDCGSKEDPKQGREYFTMLVGQLNRRRNITGPQQYLATCNPKGPSHWVYQVFFEEPFDHATGKTDPSFKVYHVPYKENAHRSEMKGYIETLERAVKGDPIEKARLIDGKWIERPTGNALFRDYYVASRHVCGDAAAGTGLVPVKGFPCAIGWDPGMVFNSAVFMQYTVTDAGPLWLIFDEVVHLREKLLYKQIANEVAERMLDWNKAVGYTIPWEQITDSAAISMFRPGDGSYDAWELQRELNKHALQNGWPEVRMVGCPKGAGSVEARVRLVQAKLHQDQIRISDICSHVKETMLMLESKEGEEWKPKRCSGGFIHTFDALSYVLLKFELSGGSLDGPVVRSITTLR